jgi:hypothetical protein
MHILQACTSDDIFGGGITVSVSEAVRSHVSPSCTSKLFTEVGSLLAVKAQSSSFVLIVQQQALEHLTYHNISDL